MKASSIQDIKQELATLPSPQLIELCLRLARFKQDNKALLSYLLFQAGDEQGYIAAVQEEIAEQFAHINTSSVYFIKKSLRKIIRIINRYSTYSGVKTTEAELRLFFCRQFNSAGMPAHNSKVLQHIYAAEVKKINAAIKTLHEDLQYDYEKALQTME